MCEFPSFLRKAVLGTVCTELIKVSDTGYGKSKAGDSCALKTTVNPSECRSPLALTIIPARQEIFFHQSGQLQLIILNLFIKTACAFVRSMYIVIRWAMSLKTKNQNQAPCA